MKKAFKMFCGLFMFMALVVPFSGVNAAPVEVSDEAELRNAVLEGGDIVLTNDIKVSSPIDLLKDTTITSKEGSTFTIDGEGMTRNPDGNGSILAAHANLTLTNVKIANANKYGVQAYNTGSVVLDGVEISGSGFGAVLINGGTVTINDLTMIDNAYGIEFGIGAQVTETPTLVMDGTLSADSQVDPLYVDTDQVNENSGMSVQNTINTVQTIDLDETAGTLVIKGEDGATLYTSNELADGTEVEVVTEEAEEPTVPETPKDENEPVKTTETIENPKTNDSILLVLGTLAVSGVVAFVAKRKLS